MSSRLKSIIEELHSDFEEDLSDDLFTEDEIIAQLGFTHIPRSQPAQDNPSTSKETEPSAIIKRPIQLVDYSDSSDEQDVSTDTKDEERGPILRDKKKRKFFHHIDPDSDNSSQISVADSEYLIENEELQDKDSSKTDKGQLGEPLENHLDMNQGRKRSLKANEGSWKRNKNKLLRMKGKDYLGYRKPKGRSSSIHDSRKPARIIGLRCTSSACQKSSKRCCGDFTEEVRREIFTYFWDEMNWDQRKVFVSTMVEASNTDRVRTESGNSRRGVTYKYYLMLKEGSERKQVCQKTFLQTLSIGKWSVHDWVTKGDYGMNESSGSAKEKRTPQVSNKQVQKQALDLFLESLPKMPSHYCRHDTRKLYLENIYQSMSEVYRAYCTVCKEGNTDSLSRSSFDDAVKLKNIGLFQPKKDECDTCCEHRVGNLSEETYQRHVALKEQARQAKKVDKNNCAEGACHVLTVDLQAVKIAPNLNASALYYKTKLCVHNYTVYNMRNHHVTCYWWTETEGDLTASSFTSCLIDYISEHLITPENEGVPVIIWSDGCTYQNRNAVLSNALLNLAVKSQTVIEQKFLEKGHTQMECDSVHAAIERRLKGRIINLPSDYVSATTEARTKLSPYDTKYLKFSFFKDYTNPKNMRYTSIRPGTKAHDHVVTEIRALMYSPDGSIRYKLEFTDDYQELPRRQVKVPEDIVYPNMYNEQRKIKEQKFIHLQQLKSVLPAECHAYYDALPH